MQQSIQETIRENVNHIAIGALLLAPASAQQNLSQPESILNPDPIENQLSAAELTALKATPPAEPTHSNSLESETLPTLSEESLSELKLSQVLDSLRTEIHELTERQPEPEQSWFRANLPLFSFIGGMGVLAAGYLGKRGRDYLKQKQSQNKVHLDDVRIERTSIVSEGGQIERENAGKVTLEEASRGDAVFLKSLLRLSQQSSKSLLSGELLRELDETQRKNLRGLSALKANFKNRISPTRTHFGSSEGTEDVPIERELFHRLGSNIRANGGATTVGLKQTFKEPVIYALVNERKIDSGLPDSLTVLVLSEFEIAALAEPNNAHLLIRQPGESLADHARRETIQQIVFQYKNRVGEDRANCLHSTTSYGNDFEQRVDDALDTIVSDTWERQIAEKQLGHQDANSMQSALLKIKCRFENILEAITDEADTFEYSIGFVEKKLETCNTWLKHCNQKLREDKSSNSSAILQAPEQAATELN